MSDSIRSQADGTVERLGTLSRYITDWVSQVRLLHSLNG